jgi:hypothetical protein
MDFWKQEVLRGGPETPNARLQGDFLAPNRRLKGALRPPIEKVSANTARYLLEYWQVRRDSARDSGFCGGTKISRLGANQIRQRWKHAVLASVTFPVPSGADVRQDSGVKLANAVPTYLMHSSYWPAPGWRVQCSWRNPNISPIWVSPAFRQIFAKCLNLRKWQN